MKKFNIVSLIFVFCLCLSCGTYAQESGDKVNADVIVNQQENTIKMIYPDSEYDNIKGVFDDIPDNAWYNMYVSLLNQINVINGVTASDFDPGRNITRGEFTKLLAMMSGEELSPYANTSSFEDVSNDMWYEPFISWANQKEIVKGKTAGSFCAEDNITREEAIVTLYRFAHDYGVYIADTEAYFAHVYGEANFNDKQTISDWATEAVSYMGNAGIINGGPDNMFRPQDFITRAEAAKILASYYITDKRPVYLVDGLPPTEMGSSLDIYSQSENALMSMASVDPVEDEINFCEGVVVKDENGEAISIDSVYGAGDMSGVSYVGDDHFYMTGHSFGILNNDNNKNYTPVKITNLVGKYSATAQTYVQAGSVAPDHSETQFKFAMHYYNGYTGLSKDYKDVNIFGYQPSKHNARWGFNDHYANASYEYSKGNYQRAYNELGRSLHYLEDTNSPPHAKLVDNSGPKEEHSNYEKWVYNNFSMSNIESSARNSYAYISRSTTTFLAMSNNFSQLAHDSWDTCKVMDNGTEQEVKDAKTATRTNLKRTQRAIAGILYRFLITTGREW